jgi:hypothetical protein
MGTPDYEITLRVGMNGRNHCGSARGARGRAFIGAWRRVATLTHAPLARLAEDAG